MHLRIRTSTDRNPEIFLLIALRWDRGRYPIGHLAILEIGEFYLGEESSVTGFQAVKGRSGILYLLICRVILLLRKF